jgi:anti-sigma factor RsiW
MRLLRPDPLACKEFVELVTDYLEGALPRGQRRSLEGHLKACPGCRTYLEQVRITIHSLGELPPVPPSDPETREHLLRAFRELRGSG